MAFPEANLIFPIHGSHVREALIVARVDQDAFRQAEMSWLETHNMLLWTEIGDLFGTVIKQEGIEEGNAAMAGKLLGNHSVRLCLQDSEAEYERARLNYQRNTELDNLRLARPGVSKPPLWDDPDVLLKVFGDEDLVAALSDIKTDRSRRAAANTIGFFCLADMPDQL